MKLIERWMVKLIIFHFILLLLIQGILHSLHFFQDYQKITFYEGVNKMNETPIIETWKNHH
ncbi:DUF5359 family protein [Bacillus sp. Gen3]|uniref:DUF5359 family protein n=1 Tax=Heyndrickxia oleronia TaxID=38875 RepID=UPI0015D1F19A|nr:DUF5359 family protein [Heyndrickxia oleronia]NYV66079.1 DUF5359 family protein [Bacillus sp. Gen3]